MDLPNLQNCFVLPDLAYEVHSFWISPAVSWDRPGPNVLQQRVDKKIPLILLNVWTPSILSISLSFALILQTTTGHLYHSGCLFARKSFEHTLDIQMYMLEKYPEAFWCCNCQQQRSSDPLKVSFPLGTWRSTSSAGRGQPRRPWTGSRRSSASSLSLYQCHHSRDVPHRWHLNLGVFM